MPVAGILSYLVTASVLEETVQGERISYLNWPSLAGFSDLVSVTLLKGAKGGLRKVGS